MNYDLVIYEIRNPNAFTILAHQLARNPAITLQKAFEMLEKLPQTLFKNISESSMHTYITQYSHHGVILKALPSDVPIKQSGRAYRIPVLKSVVQDFRLEDKKLTRNVTYSNEAFHQSLVGQKSDMQELKLKKTRMKPTLLGSLFFLVLVLVGVIILLFDHNRVIYGYARMKISSQTSNLEVPREKQEQIEMKSKKIEGRKRVSTEQKMESEMMVDSAKFSFSDINRMIKFYKIAISFNRFNANAWFGLLSTYKSAGMEVNYQQCLNDMKQIFGDQIFVTSSIVEKYGTILDSYISEDSILRISYKSEVKTEETLLRHIYMIMRNMEAQPHLNGISVSSIDSGNKEIIVHVRPGMHIETFDDFKQNASINIFK